MLNPCQLQRLITAELKKQSVALFTEEHNKQYFPMVMF